MLADQLLDFFSVKHLYQQLKGYIAKDSSIVHSSGNETIAGTKAFSSTIVGSVSGTAAGLSANSGVTAGSYGPSADASPEAGGTITVPQVTVDEKGLVTGAANRTITFPSGGGSEEQFEKVYETTLAEDTTHFVITNTDMDGVFVDVVVYVVLNYANAGDLFSCGFLAGSTALQTVPYIKMTDSSPNLVFSCESRSGLLYGGYTMYDDGHENIDEQYHSAQGYSPEFYNGGEYPTEEKPGISLIGFGFYDQTTLIPAGTTITVYARKKVADPEPES